ncbi:hypothetical protein D9M68_604070 [compost metagenome]
MKTFKQLAFAAAVLATPFMAQAELKAMEDSALATVTGQDGISISGNFGGEIGSVVYTDGDTNGGSLRLETITFTDLAILDSDPIKVDVVTNAGGTQQLAITLPAMEGSVGVGAIKIGDTTAASIGSLAINNIDMSGTTIKVWGH